MPQPINGNQHSATLDDIYEVVTFIKDNVPTREEVITKEEAVTKEEFNGLKSEVDQIKATTVNMVTKDYLDDKLSDLRGDLVVMLRKGDTKLKVLAEMLHDKKVLNRTDVKRIYSLEPFAQQFQN